MDKKNDRRHKGCVKTSLPIQNRCMNKQFNFKTFVAYKNVTKMLVKYETTSLNEIRLIFKTVDQSEMRIHTNFNKRLFVRYLILNQLI